MQKLPPLVMECPECGEQFLISRDSDNPSENATIFSDGFFLDELNWRTPEVIGCVTCELGFFLHEGKLVAEPNWEEYNEKWSHLKKAEPPTAGSLALELRARKNMIFKVESALRKEFWYAGIHSETGRILMGKNEKFKNFWFDSLSKFESMIQENNLDDILLKAECNRQLGHFTECIKLINNTDQKLAQLIKSRAENKDSEVFVVN